ncbi:MAG: LysM peptidoglycan-binding domain-containing M23 family metallopeptidase [Synechococcus sp.]
MSFIPSPSTNPTSQKVSVRASGSLPASPSFCFQARLIQRGLSGVAGAALAVTLSVVAMPRASASQSFTSRRNTPVPIYVVQSGDTVESIASRYNLSVSSLQAANGEQPLPALSAGDEINLPWVPSVLVHPDFATGSDRGMRMAALQMLPPDFEASFMWPVNGSISSRYGWRWGRMHRGIDIQGPVGTPVVSAMDGTVTFAGWDRGGYGYRVDVVHPNGYMTRYAHGQEILVSEGDRVEQGQKLMTRGSTGRSTGPHLHFEIRRNGMAINPESILTGAGPVANESLDTGSIGGAIAP